MSSHQIYQSQFPGEQLFLSPSHAFREEMAKLHAALADRLPHHMIPTLFLPLKNIPLTATGKTDRKYLRDCISQLSSEQINSYLGNERSSKVMPTTTTEITLQRAWAKELGLHANEIGIDDTWTRLGGDSISAMRITSSTRLEGLSITAPDILRHKTIKALAQSVDGGRVPKNERIRMGTIQPFMLLGPDSQRIIKMISEEYQIHPSSLDDAYPCAGVQNDHIALILQRRVNNTMRLEFQMPGNLDRDRFISAWEGAVATNPILRTRIIKTSEGNYLQAVLRQGLPLIILHENDERIADYTQGLDIWSFGKPLVRAALRGKSFIVLIHHILYDGFSWPLIFQEIDRAYRGEVLQFHSYVPFVKWALETRASTRQFWAEKLTGLSGPLFPPVSDGSPIPIDSRSYHCQLSIVHDDFTAANKIRLALAITMSWYHQTTDIVLGTVFSRRSIDVPDIATLPAPTAMVFPDRIQLQPTESLWFNLERVQDDALATMEFQGINLQDIAGLGTDGTLSCQFQTLLSVQGDKDISDDSIFRNWNMPKYGMTAAPNLYLAVSLSTNAARVDLHLNGTPLNPHIQWQSFLDQFQAVFELLQLEPKLTLADANFTVFHTA